MNPLLSPTHTPHALIAGLNQLKNRRKQSYAAPNTSRAAPLFGRKMTQDDVLHSALEQHALLSMRE